uniref:mRNA cap guanine-N(7) methyltransferase n=1 Tax=Lygus hesperus TaxID=30085 RepID=A0A0A9YUQ9_LYGHE
MATPTGSSETPKGNAEVVQKHYNSIQEKGLDHRNQSRIVYLRNFNNWIKGMLIDEYLTMIKEKKKKDEPLRVIDMCCGKGGDLLKWNKGEVNHAILVDIADQSVADAQKRYTDMKAKTPRLFSAEFLVADVTRTSIRALMKDPTMKVDLVSCQFSLHYSFESLPQAEKMLENISASLKKGGYFIGTVPNAYDIVGRKRLGKTNWFGNSVFTITFEDTLPEPLPLFGARYNFHLHEVLDCPEYLVHFPTFERLAERYGFKSIKKKRFQNYYEDMKRKGQTLLHNMSALETYPPVHGVHLLGPKSDYAHAKEYFEEFPGNKFIGTLSRSEWEVCSLYMTFAFEKVRDWSPPKPQ